MGGCCSCSGADDVSKENPHGKPKNFDPNFKGPIKNRSCTDILCCLIFFVFVIGFIVVGLFAWLNGDPIILLNPTDTQGRICGVNYTDLDLRGKEYLLYFDITRCASPAVTVTFQCPTTQICVSSCPNDTWTYIVDVGATTFALETNSNREEVANNVDWSKYICTYGFNARNEFINNNVSIQDMISRGKCAPYYVPYEPVVKRCIPKVVRQALNFTYNVANSAVAVVNTNNQTVSGESLEEGLSPIRLYLEAQRVGEMIFADLTVSWYWLLIGMVIAAVVAFLWIVIMRWVAGIMVWVTLLGLVGILSFGIWYCYDEYNILLTTPGSNRSLLSVGFTTELEVYLALQDTWLAFLIILSVLDFILILMIIFLRKRIQIAIKVIGEASKAIGEMISTLFYPLVTFVLVLVVVAFWAATALFLASTGEPVYTVIDTRNISGEDRTGERCNVTISVGTSVVRLSAAMLGCLGPQDVCSVQAVYSLEFNNNATLNESLKCVFDMYGGDSVFHQNTGWLQIYEAFGMLWLVNWVIALGQMTLAGALGLSNYTYAEHPFLGSVCKSFIRLDHHNGAFASYYWAWKKPRDIPLLPVYSSFGRALRYHTGSLAFGSLIIALIQLVRIVLEYIDHKLKGKENKVAKFLICCCKCCFWCLEKFMKFLNRNAYIMIAIYGKNFCWSAKEAFKLLLRNVVRVFVLDKVTDFLVLMGKLIVAIGMGALSWAFFTNRLEPLSLVAPTLNYYWMLVIIIGLGSYFIASGFFSTFGMAVDTIFLCFLEDLERNDGSEEKPYFMNKGLMKLLGKKNKKPDS